MDIKIIISGEETNIALLRTTLHYYINPETGQLENWKLRNGEVLTSKSFSYGEKHIYITFEILTSIVSLSKFLVGEFDVIVESIREPMNSNTYLPGIDHYIDYRRVEKDHVTKLSTNDAIIIYAADIDKSKGSIISALREASKTKSKREVIKENLIKW